VTLEEFRASVASGRRPGGLDTCLSALWDEARGDWKGAHETVQEESGEAAAWIHAYLHRKEGDLGNARYWYARAARPTSSAPHDDEWSEIVSALLQRG
jgi:hypothetical protein